MFINIRRSGKLSHITAWCLMITTFLIGLGGNPICLITALLSIPFFIVSSKHARKTAEPLQGMTRADKMAVGCLVGLAAFWVWVIFEQIKYG